MLLWSSRNWLNPRGHWSGNIIPTLLTIPTIQKINMCLCYMQMILHLLMSTYIHGSVRIYTYVYLSMLDYMKVIYSLMFILLSKLDRDTSFLGDCFFFFPVRMWTWCFHVGLCEWAHTLSWTVLYSESLVISNIYIYCIILIKNAWYLIHIVNVSNNTLSVSSLLFKAFKVICIKISFSIYVTCQT